MNKLILILAAATLIGFVGCNRKTQKTYPQTPLHFQYDVKCELELLNLHNRARALDCSGNDCNPLQIDPDLRAAAMDHAAWMAKHMKLSHEANGGVTARIERHGKTKWHTWGENIAYGQSTPEEVFDGWMDSRGHRKNILNPRFQSVGFYGAMGADGYIYWCAVFGG